MSKLFSPEELSEICKSLPQQALEALQSGNHDRLARLLMEMSVAHAGLHALGTASLTRIWSKWHRDFGEQRCVETLQRIGRVAMREFTGRYKAGERKQAVATLVSIFKHQHGSVLNAVAQNAEDGLVFELTPCGSGGVNLVRGFEKRMPDSYRRLENGLPVFCAGCQALQQAFNEGCGADIWSTEPDREVTGACTMRFRTGEEQTAPLFSTRELQELVRTRAQQAIEKLSLGKTDIGDLIEDQQHDWAPWHDFMVIWCEYTFAACEELGGLDYLDDCLKDGYDSAFGFLYASMEAFPDDRARVNALAQNWHYHQGAFRLEEEEDRFVFILDPCGSGGRLLREETTLDFHYGTELAPIVRQKHPMTFQRDEFPMYCVHCASGNRDQFAGKPLIFVVDGHAQMRRGQVCRQYVWKKGATSRPERRLVEQLGIPLLDVTGSATDAG